MRAKTSDSADSANVDKTRQCSPSLRRSHATSFGMAETQQVETHSDSARFKTAESGLCTLKHALIRQGSRPPNQNCADSTTASLGITARCLNWGNFHHGIEHIVPKHSAEKVLQMQLPPHGRDESLFHFRMTQAEAFRRKSSANATTSPEHIGPKHSAEKVLQMQLPPHGRDES